MSHDDSDVSLGQLAQMHELEKARRRIDLPGCGPSLQKYLRGQQAFLSSAPVKAAYPLWKAGWCASGETFESYLASIPEPPQFPDAWQTKLPLCILVDPSATVVGACISAGITPIDIPASIRVRGPQRPQRPYWIVCRKESRDDLMAGVLLCGIGLEPWEQGMTIVEAMAMILQLGKLPRLHRKMLMLGSVAGSDDDPMIPAIDEHGTAMRMVRWRGALGSIPTCAFMDEVQS
ncbi:MAG: hypothetical protein V1778_05075 [bacterium]